MRNPLLRLLRVVTSRSVADAIAGDLHEVRIAARGGRGATACWFWRELLAVTAHAVAARLRSVLGALTPGRLFGGTSGDLRHALRLLGHARSYAGASVGVIALGIGLATVVFAVVDGILFKPLPYPSADQLFVIRPYFKDLDPALGSPSVSARDLRDWRDAIPEVAFAGASDSIRQTLGSGINEVSYATATVDEQFFDVLGIRPMIGGFRAEHFVPADAGLPRPAIVTFDVWQGRFGGDPRVVGRRLVVDDVRQQAIEIVGVMPRSFAFPSRLDAKVIFPAVLSPDARSNPRARRYGQVIARLQAGLDPDVVRQRLELAMLVTAAGFPPAPSGGWRASPRVRFMGPFDLATLGPLRGYLNTQQRPLAMTVFLASAVLILLSCVNVAGLMAARGHQRVRELAVRRALGASRLVIARLVLVEAFVISALGTALGVAAAIPGLQLAVRWLPESLHPLKSPAIDWRVMGFSVLAMAVATLGVGGWPAVQGARLALGPVANDGGGFTRRVRRFGRVVIASEVAVGLVLVLGGALIVGSLIRVWIQDVGFDRDDVVAIQLRLVQSPQRGGAADLDQLLDEVRALPGVAAAGATDALLLQRASWGGAFAVPLGAANPRLFVDSHGVTAGFFDVLRPTLVDGRYPTPSELAGGGSAVVMGRHVAQEYWPNQSALGLQLEARGRTFTVVGVVEDARYGAWDHEPRWVVYGPYEPLAMSSSPNLLVRTVPGSPSPIGIVLDLIQRHRSSLRAVRVDTVDTLLADSIRPRRFQSWLFGSFALAALGIVGVGVLGLAAMTTARRTREIGIRLALGATRQGIVRQFLTEQGVALIAGLSAGGAMAVWAVRFLRAYLYQLTPYDWHVWTVAVVIVAAIAGVGTWIVAQRAGRVNPILALRHD